MHCLVTKLILDATSLDSLCSDLDVGICDCFSSLFFGYVTAFTEEIDRLSGTSCIFCSSCCGQFDRRLITGVIYQCFLRTFGEN